MTDFPAGDALVIDLHSQALCLKDALASGSDRAVVHAFEAVARARGLTQLAADAGVDRSRLTEMLGGAAPASADDLKGVIAALIGNWESTIQNGPSGNLEKDRLEDEKT